MNYLDDWSKGNDVRPEQFRFVVVYVLAALFAILAVAWRKG